MKLNTRTVGSMLMMATLALSPLAEAKRIGGGSSYGMSRSSSSHSSSSYGSSNNSGGTVRPYQQPAQQQAAPQRSGPGWGGVAAGVAGGALLGSMIGHSNNANANTTAAQPAQTENGSGAWNQAQPAEKKGGFPWFLLIVLAGVGYFVYRRFAAKKPALASNAPASASPFGFGNSNATPQPFPSSGSNTNIFGQAVGGGASNAGFGSPAPFTSNGQTLPDGTENAVFLRQARATFLHMQTMNSSSNLEELRRYFTPEMFNAVQSDIANNHDTAEFPQLNAQIVDSAQENGQYVVSVLYSGTVSEDVNSAPTPFSETWHFVQTIGSTDRKWLVAGIQQG
ncbi:Tim44 domain-containing protein [Aquirhabdus parva]|uniref:Tim44 domain-containing protein n=1 Tax=Aquirhabdus parva TaxID=2283318 RepID=A0A345P765_9GAMM|nr:Tim44-like domain-containing protein [Aquirhabdus parva]AXI03124.1 Tim44 domain-containing protein [Aquirhabdus parva]